MKKNMMHSMRQGNPCCVMMREKNDPSKSMKSMMEMMQERPCCRMVNDETDEHETKRQTVSN